MILALVIPCYNEKDILPQSYEALCLKLKALISSQQISPKSFLCFIDDGSKDSTWEILNSFTQSPTYPLTTAIKLSRNCGHQNALLAGLEYVSDKCDCAMSIDCDLQDDISVIDEFILKAKTGAEVIYGVRKSRHKDSFFKKYSALGFYKLMEFMGVKIVYNHADYRLLSARAIKSLLNFSEVNLFLRGIVPLLGFKSDVVEYDRLERLAGESKYPLKKMLSFAWNGITSFSVVPLRIVSMLGILFFIFSFLLIGYVLFVKIFTDDVVQGWASVIIPLCFFSGIQLLSLGVVGEYIGKIYAETKARPRYFIEDIANPRKNL
ncbi:glycosyltransferase family 2 protein [Helicobacter sp. MIT 21-1697]|uniref:glycosyltransferase family 2 protein n=1 Tax=Helicobacter sp. MIT 21-1697 TaxID=2993733 RepID=UPI00224B7C4F|nr:glycosyltransferase family 2 protein [Helicobacter sp. MIT 21-1697]MCX2717531.1 glycosyltransferase family 2 protein [Helicobacter sp. MIT 21-1697]